MKILVVTYEDTSLLSRMSWSFYGVVDKMKFNLLLDYFQFWIVVLYSNFEYERIM